MGTFGLLEHEEWSCFTVERPWRQNKPTISCIPAGLYPLKLGTFYSGDGPGGKPDYPAYELLNVPQRAQIKIHKANLATDVEGCIGVGMGLGSMGGKWAVVNSILAYDQLMKRPPADEIFITWQPIEAP